MSLQSQDEVDSNHLLSAKIDNAKNVLQLLKAVSFKDTATIFGSNEGLKVTVEDAKCAQANAFIAASIFQEYTVSDDLIAFKISLNVLLSCLNIFGLSSNPNVTPALTLNYDGHGTPVNIVLEEAGVVTECKIITQEADETLDFNFTNDKVVNKVIIRSDCLKEVFAELDSTSDLLELRLSPNIPHFRLSTHGNYGVNHTDISKDSEVVETFKCKVETVYKYKLALLKHSVKAMAASQKVSIRIDDRGFLCMQFMILTEDNHTAFVEFFCCPEEEAGD